jgi:zinc protease
MHEGRVLPIEQTDSAAWLRHQEASDREDARILGGIVRQAPVAAPRYAHTVLPQEPKPFDFPIASTFTLSNGVRVFAHQRDDIGKVDIILDLQSKHYTDGFGAQGLSMMVADLLEEGTLRHSGPEIAQMLESMGMEFNAFPGQFAFSMLSRDIQRGLELFAELLFEPAFAEESIERVREQMLAELDIFWDTPADFIVQVARQEVYQKHPYACHSMGDKQLVSGFSRSDILSAYQRTMSPDGARIAIVGDFSSVDIHALLQKTFGAWSGPSVAKMVFPVIPALHSRERKIAMARDQYVLAYAGRSVARLDTRFDALLLFDQILAGGVLGSMSSRLFDLREATGLFYSIGGSLLAGAAREPGMIFIKSFISGDRLSEAERSIEGLLAQGAHDCTEQELDEARRAIINSYVDNFASQKQTAATFLLLDYYGFAPDHYAKRADVLRAVQLADLVKAVDSVLSVDQLIRIEIGRF